MILFIIIIVSGFSGIGNALNSLKEEPFAVRFMPWAMGASLFAHSVAFISVAYFDQLSVFWNLLLTMISAISAKPHTVQAEVESLPKLV